MSTQSLFKIVNATFYVLFGVLVFSVAACSSTDKLNNEKKASDLEINNNHDSSINNISRNIDLTTHLKRISGVRVRGDGPNATVTVRAGEVSTFSGSTSPLFVVDGQTMNVGYNHVYNMVSPHSIKKIEVLKGAEAAIYGIRGGNGVIVISTR